MNKIQESHLKRSAYVYVRQSSPGQVINNVESGRRQYALTDRAKQIGWDRVHVIDDDQGRSAGGHVQRRGFEALLEDVCQGQVGAVFVIEGARLARNGNEWHRLLEFCAVVDTLIVDHDGIYDPKHPNDRLLLGLKGMMSEMEVGTFRQRSQEAIKQKAGRGEYYTRIPEGYVLCDSTVLEKDPDEQVQQAIALVFRKLRELGSARQVFLWFLQEEIKLPRRLGKSSRVEFVAATPWLITRLVKDPAYAGAYAHGRTKRRTVIENGQKRVLREHRPCPEDWEVLILDHHAAYISWQEYIKNQEMLANNRSQMSEATQGAARRGKGLLAGLIRCGYCGKKMRVNYGGRGTEGNSTSVYYICRASQHDEIQKQNCRLFGGVALEQAISEAVLHAVEPIRMEAMIQAAERVTTKRGERRRQLALELDRCRYEADRCQRQYHAVEPENRLVARNLETRWNQSLDKVEQLEQQLSVLAECDESLSSHDLDKLRSLALDLPSLWNRPDASNDLKKRLLRCVIKEIVVYVDHTTIRALVHWRGGQHSELNLRKRKTGEHRWKTADDISELIRQLARLMPDKQIAAQLNRMGIKSAKGHTWTRTRVGNFRTMNGIANYTPGERQARGELTIEEVSGRLGVSYSTVQRMIQRKQLPATQVCPGAPWIILAEDVQAIAKESPSSTSSKQQTLNFPDHI